MIDRRHLLLSAAFAAVLPAMRAIAEPGPPATDESRKLKALFDRLVNEQLQRSPELATSLGLDKGPLAALKSRLSDASLAATALDKVTTARRLEELKAIDRSVLTGLDASSYDTVLFVLAVQDENNRSFDYGGGNPGTPYILSQLTGAYQSVPDFLDTQHSIRNKADADAYLARLEAFATVMDQELEQARHDAGVGVVPPDFVLEKALIQMKAFLDTPAEKATVVTSIARRAKEAKLSDLYAAKAATLYTGTILPALGRQAAFLKELRVNAVHDAGVARLPKGADYYRVSLKNYTTSSWAPDEIHRTGLDLVEKLSTEIDVALKSRGISDGTVGRRLAALAADPQFLYDNNDAAKEKLVADLNAKVVAVQAKLPCYFGALPRAKVEIRRVPKNIEAGAPGGYYQPGSLDGARPGAYYINLRDTSELPNWSLSTLTFHDRFPVTISS